MFEYNCRQISFELAVALGLKSHPKLVGRSSLADGSAKVDYLCLTTVSILGIEAPLVVKVAPNQPNLFGLDGMFLFDMDLRTVKREFSISQTPTNLDLVPFRWLRHPALLKSLEISPEDLVPVKDLPPPDLAYKALIDAGQSARVLDLGTASASPWIRPKLASTLDLSFSYYLK